MLPQNEYIVDFGVMGFRNVLMCLTERNAEAHATRVSPRPVSTQRMNIEMSKFIPGPCVAEKVLAALPGTPTDMAS